MRYSDRQKITKIARKVTINVSTYDIIRRNVGNESLKENLCILVVPQIQARVEREG